jgi:hypothetical protein
MTHGGLRHQERAKRPAHYALCTAFAHSGVRFLRWDTAERWTCVLKMLAQWLQSARLETLTKESYTYASSMVANLGCKVNVNVGGILLLGVPLTNQDLLCKV